MTQNELAYMCWELLRGGSVVDDERLDIRLLYDWIDLKRAQYIKTSLSQNPNNRISLNAYQKETFTTTIKTVVDNGDYPYIDGTTQSYEIVESVESVPAILEGKSGPLVLSLESQDLMKLPFCLVDYDYLKFSGSGKFNRNLIFGAIRDKKLYFKYHQYFDTYNKVVLRAIFETPRDVPGFDEDVTEYPVDAPLIEYIKNGILQVDMKQFIMAVTDETSDSSGQIKS